MSTISNEQIEKILSDQIERDIKKGWELISN